MAEEMGSMDSVSCTVYCKFHEYGINLALYLRYNSEVRNVQHCITYFCFICINIKGRMRGFLNTISLIVHLNKK